tara:strand:- start:179 stop:367 length:189 start_codon:yes stop_codon:yes gene_type:complete
MSEPAYVLVCSETNSIKTDGGTGMLCIFDTVEQAKKVKSTYKGTGETHIVKCNLNFTDKEIL